MSKIYKSSDELIGKTPLLELSSIEKKLDLKAKIIAKLDVHSLLDMTVVYRVYAKLTIALDVIAAYTTAPRASTFPLKCNVLTHTSSI